MTSVGGIRSAAPMDTEPARRSENGSSHAAKTETGRALIALKPVERGSAAPHYQPRASFLAHLIATAHQLPQTRERRRAEPEHVVAVYTAANAETAPPAGRKLRRAV